MRGGVDPQVGEYVVDFLPKGPVSVLVPDELVAEAVDAIVAGARIGRIGDGKIFSPFAGGRMN